MSRRVLQNKGERGFTLIECIIAMLVTVIGLLAALTMIAFAVKSYTVSSDLAIANSLAKAKVEELRNASQAPGGNLANNTTGYFDQPTSKFIRRWQITDDSMGTQTLSVNIVPAYPGILLPEVNVRTRK
ncbi:MAG TPA: prepilin-type N-terminal cleavage/methylation domain-containing protein [Pyrinomonadaceae bacterium]|jgi:prepilin-type N-terminal cleavage/methylation domain-containing protein